MESLYEENRINNIKSEQVCRTCLIDEGHFFNISDTFDHYTLTQMIQNITNLQIHPTDGYTQFICEKCIQKLREAHTFRIQCLESYNTLTTLVSVSVGKAELIKLEVIKQEICENKSKAANVESDFENNDNYFPMECRKSDKGSKTNISNSPTPIFDCPLCHGLFTCCNDYQRHIKELHPDRVRDDCFSQKRKALGYILKEKYSKRIHHIYKCVFDEFIGNKFIEFKNHMKVHTGEKPVICIECGFRTAEIRLLKIHRLQKHVEEKKFSCSLCNYSCQTQNALKGHLAIHTNEKNYKCKLCSMTFKFASGLSIHKMKIHEKRKPHVCGICQKAYFDTKELKKHMLTHTGERPHICQYCGKGFSQASNMRSHVAIKHEPSSTIFKCDQCDYSTKQKSVLKTHVQRHNGEKKFFCSECPFSSLFNHTLKIHMLRHSGVKRFACDLCDYKCLNIHELTQHKRIHTGEKPFSCTVCDYSGKTRQALTRHMLIHSAEQKFECPNCPYKTNIRGILSKHMRKSCNILKKSS